MVRFVTVFLVVIAVASCNDGRVVFARTGAVNLIAFDQTNVFWTTSTGFALGSATGKPVDELFTQKKDGSGLRRLATGDGQLISSIALDGPDVFWAATGWNGSDAVVKSVSKEGGEVRTLASAQTISGSITARNGRVFWGNDSRPREAQEQWSFDAPCRTTDELKSIARDGTGPITHATGLVSAPLEIVVDDQFLYFPHHSALTERPTTELAAEAPVAGGCVDSVSLVRLPLTGGPMKVLQPTILESITSDRASLYVYARDSRETSLVAVTKDRGEQRRVLLPGSTLVGMDGAAVYWVAAPVNGVAGRTVFRTPKDGGASVMTAVANAGGVVLGVDDGWVYFRDDDQTLWRQPIQ